MVGFGYDVHRLAPGESLILGGVAIESEFGTVAHSDGDVLVHALMDAILGAAGMGDIGEHFPDTNEKYRGISSISLLDHTIALIEEKSYSIVNADITLTLETPKIKKYKPQMREIISKCLKIDIERVNIKATTGEKLGFVGRSEGIAAYCIIEMK